ncbi:hypothetical protein acdb102_18520 [Acidothermaceae bacterium B102]|nr:hypothetical protein acdb102_18520 [Acidothermaceae bacterium B102]
MKRFLTAGAVLLAATTLTGCSGGGVSADGLGRAVGTAYQRLYVVQQHDLGRTEVTPPDRAATCTRNGSGSGSGSWVCTVHFPYPDGHLVPLSFDVEVQPIGCYTATGPPAVVGQLTLASPAGGSVTNPLFAFDGCLATG